ncbi:hypothetical protein ACX40Y_13255 [Sphingomonas sp. RS6]
MAAWFASGHAVDLVLAVIAAELCWLVAARGWRLGDALLRLLPGALMLVALRAALVGAAWPWIALALALSFPIHLADLSRSRR